MSSKVVVSGKGGGIFLLRSSSMRQSASSPPLNGKPWLAAAPDYSNGIAGSGSVGKCPGPYDVKEAMQLLV